MINQHNGANRRSKKKMYHNRNQSKNTSGQDSEETTDQAEEHRCWWNTRILKVFVSQEKIGLNIDVRARQKGVASLELGFDDEDLLNYVGWPKSNSPHTCCLQECAPIASCLWCTFLLGPLLGPLCAPCWPITVGNTSMRLLAERTIHSYMI